MSLTTQGLGGIAALTFGFMSADFVGGVVSPPPPIEIVSVIVENNTVVYHRKLTMTDSFRAPWYGYLFVWDSEKEVRNCTASGQSTYRPDEKEIQMFSIDTFFGKGCEEVLVDGVCYGIYAQVTPVGKSPGTYTSPECFVWSKGEEDAS